MWADTVKETYDFKTFITTQTNTSKGTKVATYSGPSTYTGDLYLLNNPVQNEQTLNLNGRFAIDYGANESVKIRFMWRTHASYEHQKGLAGAWNGNGTASGGPNNGACHLSILNLKAGDKVTITFSTSKNDAIPRVCNSGVITGVAADAQLTSGTQYTIAADGNLDIYFADNNFGIHKVEIETEGTEAIDTNPVASVTGANNGDRTVTIVSPKTTSGNDTKTYYTKDGSTPTSASTLYSGPFIVTSSDKVDGKVTIKSITYKDGNTNIASGVSTLEINDVGTTLQLNAPVISLSSFIANGLVYNPKYTFTQDQSNIVGAPAAKMEYSFASGSYTEASDYTATATGRLTVKVSASGYTDNTAYIDISNVLYAKDYYADFSTLIKDTKEGYNSETFNNAGCDFYTFENSFSDKVTLSGFSLAFAITAAKVQGVFARGSAGTLTYTGSFPTNSVIYLSCGTKTSTYTATSTADVVNIPQHEGVYNMTVYVPTTEVDAAIADCKSHETSAAFATAIDAKSFASVADVYAFHTQWQIEQADAASSNDITKAIFDAAVSDFSRWNNARSSSGQQYTDAPDNKYFDAWDNSASDAKQKIYGLPAGTYTLKVATRASADVADKSKYKVWVYGGSADVSVLGNHIGNTGGVLGNGWNWTILSFTLAAKADVEIGFYSCPPTERWASCDDWHLYKGTLSVSGTITPAGWSSFASSYPLNLSTLTATSGATAYYASAADGSTVTLTPTGNVTVPAGEGIMIKGTAGETFTIDVAESGTAIDGNLLKGQTTTDNVDASNKDSNGKYHYIFGYVTETPSTYGFYNLASDTSVPAGKAYLETTTALTQPDAARLTIVFDDEATGIQNLTPALSEGEGVVYNLRGQRVAQPTKGLYIINGKKVVMK